MKSLTIQELEQIGKSEHLPISIKKAIDIILNAINDWPNPVLNLGQYEYEVKILVGGEVTKSRITQSLLQIDYSKNAWEAESVTQLLNLFEIFPNEDLLKHILRNIENEC